MAEAPSKALFTGEEVLDLLDSDIEEDLDDGMDEVFFPGSDDELGFEEVEIENGERLVKIIHTITINYLIFTHVAVMMMNAVMTRAALGTGIIIHRHKYYFYHGVNSFLHSQSRPATDGPSVTRYVQLFVYVT